MTNKRIYLSAPYVDGNERKYVTEGFDSNWISPMGPNVNAFEKEICEFVKAKHGLALSSGTAGLHLALKYAGVTEGDYVFCSTLTFAGSCNPILYEKAIPVFIDSESSTWNMSPMALEKAFEWAQAKGRLPKAVIIVDLYGQSADYKRLKPICDQYEVPIIEDAAEALGASYLGQMCGVFGDYGVFSFNGNKIITTSGGGMLVTEDEAALNKMKFWSTQSKEPMLHYEHKEIGYNYRLSNISAGIGRGQLERIEAKIKHKKEVYDNYKELLSDLPLKMMPISEDGQANYWLSVLTFDEIDVDIVQVIEALQVENIESRPLWKPMHLQPIFRDYKYFSDDFDLSADLFARGLCLPSGCELTRESQERISAIIHKAYQEQKKSMGSL